MNDRRRIVWNLGSAVVLLAGGVGLAAAKLSGAISADLMMRGVMVMIGLMGAGSHLLAKTAGAKAPTARQQGLARFLGWGLTLAGLAYAGLWAFAPLSIAMIVAPAAVLSVLIIWIWRFWRGRRNNDIAAPR
jgi:hypothetical protein